MSVWVGVGVGGGCVIDEKTLIMSILPYSLLPSIQSFTGLSFVSGQDTLTGIMTSNHSSSDASCPVNLCLMRFVAHELNDAFISVQNKTVPCENEEDIF